MNTHNINAGGGRGGQKFEDAMSNIAREAEAHRLLEARAEQRQALMSKIKKVAGFLLGLAVLATVFFYRNELQGFISAKLDSKPKIDSTTDASLNKIQSAAEKRDQVLNDISK